MSYSIGEKFPLPLLVHLLQKQGYQSISEKDFQNKSILIDFWNMWCHSCWKGMKKMDELQERFKNDLVIVKITANKKAEIEATERKLNVSPSPLLSITDDSMMNQLFPHIGDPLHLWIDQNGIIRHAAYDHNATAQNMAAFINGQQLNFSVRGDMGTSDEPKSLLENAGTTLARSVVGYSVFVKGIHEYASLASYEKKTPSQLPQTIGFYQVTLLDLFRTAYFKEVYGLEQPRFYAGNNRIVLAVKDSLPFFKSTDSNAIDGWNNRYLLSYEATIVGAKDPLEMLQLDLTKYFPYRVHVETRNVLCRVLVWNTTGHRFISRPKLSGTEYEFSSNKVSMQSFFKSLLVAAQQDALPLLTDIQWNEPISIHFQSKLENVLKEKKELQLFGLNVVEEIRPVKVLIIEDDLDENR